MIFPVVFRDVILKVEYDQCGVFHFVLLHDFHFLMLGGSVLNSRQRQKFFVRLNALRQEFAVSE